jgi:hypothetical protein
MKIADRKDLKTMQRYVRLAGVEVAGATDKVIISGNKRKLLRLVTL